MTQAELNRVIEQHKVWLDSKGEEGKRADLRDTVLRGADLSYVDLRGADLTNADLEGANLKGVDLSGVDLRYAYLKGVDLSYAFLKGVDLRDANLTCANLEGTDLEDADLEGADLEGANLKYANLTNVNLTGTGVCFFRGPKHYGTYNSKDDKLIIGCQVHSLEYWLKNYVAIGKEYKYIDKEIEVCGAWIKSLKEIS